MQGLIVFYGYFVFHFLQSDCIYTRFLGILGLFSIFAACGFISRQIRLEDRPEASELTL
jgi:hypothetical protein